MKTPTYTELELMLHQRLLEDAAVQRSASALLHGLGARIQAAIDEARATGVKARALAPVQAEANKLTSIASAMRKAVAANTPRRRRRIRAKTGRS